MQAAQILLDGDARLEIRLLIGLSSEQLRNVVPAPGSLQQTAQLTGRLVARSQVCELAPSLKRTVEILQLTFGQASDFSEPAGSLLIGDALHARRGGQQATELVEATRAAQERLQILDGNGLRRLDDERLFIFLSGLIAPILLDQHRCRRQQLAHRGAHVRGKAELARGGNRKGGERLLLFIHLALGGGRHILRLV